MTTLFKRVSMITGALLFAVSFSAPAISADAMFGTGGYAREMHTMGMMKMLDANGDHMVSHDEFTKYYGELFDMIDTDHDGTIDEKEWAGITPNMLASVATGGYARQLSQMSMMKMMDKKGDHKVTKDEFIGFHEAIFKAMDTTGNGMLTSETWISKTFGGTGK